MIEYKVLYICNYAAKYSGNFIASLSQLARMVGDKNVVYLFPTKAKGMDWINILSDHCNSMYFCDFKYKSLRTMCKQIACDIGNGNVIVHTHFVEDTLLLGVKASFKKIICHYHMTVPDTTLFRGKVKRIIRQIFYHNMVIVGVSDAVTKDLSKYFEKSNIYTKEKCRSCFAKFYCSGGCSANAFNFNGDIDKPYELACEFEKKRVECAIAIEAVKKLS